MVRQFLFSGCEALTGSRGGRETSRDAVFSGDGLTQVINAWLNFLIATLAIELATQGSAETLVKGDDAVSMFPNVRSAREYLHLNRQIGANIGDDKTIVSEERCELERAEATRCGIYGGPVFKKVQSLRMAFSPSVLFCWPAYARRASSQASRAFLAETPAHVLWAGPS